MTDTEPTSTPDTRQERAEQAKRGDALADAVIGAWESALDRFFEAVDRERREMNLSDGDVSRALARNYDYIVSDAWDEWVAE